MEPTERQTTYTAVPGEALSKSNDGPAPRLLKRPWGTVGLQLTLDLTLAAFAFMFAIFAIEVDRFDGQPATKGSNGLKLFQAAQLGPTIFPILFAAIVGRGMKNMASWLIQSRSGVTLGVIGQCLGSQTISSAFTTQVKLRTLNVVGLLIVSFWALSPVGSQASLRVINVVPTYPANLTRLVAASTLMAPLLGQYLGNSQADVITSPTVAAMKATQLLSRQNQDLWGNIRLPPIEPLEHGRESNNGEWTWYKDPENTNLAYPSLVGVPISGLPRSGNTSFILSGSYLSLSCPILRRSTQTSFTDPASHAPSTYSTLSHKDTCRWGNGTIAGWEVPESATRDSLYHQVVISEPCRNTTSPRTHAPENARSLVWESAQFNSSTLNGSMGIGRPTVFTKAECSLSTTFIDVKVTCLGGSSDSSCNPTSVRRSINPPFPKNWTVLDLTPASSPTADFLITTLNYLFPNTDISKGGGPMLDYLSIPDSGISSSTDGNPNWTFEIDRDMFEWRLGQILNSILYLGIDSTSFTGTFDPNAFNREFPPSGVDKPLSPPMLNISATTSVEQDTVRCSKAWFGALLTTSLALLLFALISGTLQFITVAPDILGSPTIAFLHNKVNAIQGSSTWSSDEWTRELRSLRLYLGDVDPEGDVGKIALATDREATHVGQIKPDRYFF